MNQILVTQKLYVTPELKRKKTRYKILFFVSVFMICVLFSYYIYAEYDKNRAEDAFDIREDYISEHGDIEEIPSTPTVLEVLLGLAKHATVMDYDPAWKWLSLFIRNLGFEGINDDNWNENTEAFVKKTVRKWLDRRFSKDGVGSPFRGNGTYDVARTSMWYSLQWYLSNEFGEGHI
jgi:hypothetical protein